MPFSASVVAAARCQLTDQFEDFHMPNLIERFQQYFQPVKPLHPGVYHYQAPPDDPRNYRLHLRIEPDGSGLLIVNASTILHLNQTATEYAYSLIQGMSDEDAAKIMAARYHVDPEQARRHYRELVDRIDTLVSSPDLDPVTFLDFERATPFSGALSAPYRLDCALTYNLPASIVTGSTEAYATSPAPVDRVTRELTTAEWITLLDKAWEVGIPHIVFTGGEPTLRDDLPDLIRHAEQNNQVTGLLTDGERLADSEYLNTLLQTGLDHLMLVLQPENQAAWEALHNALAADLFVAVHLTMTSFNQSSIPQVLDKLAAIGVTAVSLSAADPSLAEELQDLRDLASHHNMELVWNLPVPYSATNPVSLELQGTSNAADLARDAGDAWLYIEPDGDVLPGQGIPRKLGNMLRDPWESIWENAQKTP